MRTRSQYRELFRIQCLHGYFRNPAWEALQVRPSPSCLGRLARARCIFRPLAAAGVALAEVNPGGATLIEPFTDRLPFTFYVTGPRAQIESLSDMGARVPASPEPTALYFNNLADHGTGTGGKATDTYRQLHDPAASLSSQSLPLRPARCMVDATAPASATLELFDLLGNSVWKGHSPPAAMTRLPLNLTGVPEGHYRLQINGADQPPFYLCAQTAPAPWAIIEIFPGGPAMPSLPAPCRMVGDDGGTILPLAFALSIPPGKSVWRYYIVSTSSADRSYEGFAIAGGPPRGVKPNGTAPITFSPPTRQELNGLDAWVFESDGPLPLYEYPADHYSVTLSKAGKPGGSPPAALPFAQAETSRLGKTMKNQTQNLSEIFVYL